MALSLIETTRQVLDSAPEAMVVFDDGARIVFANARAERLFGYERAELAQLDFGLLLAQRCRASFRESLPSSTALTALEFVGLCKDGTELALQLSFAPGQVGATAIRTAIIREVAGGKPAQPPTGARAEEAEARLQTLLEAAPAFIMALDRAGVIEYINRVLAHYAREDVVGTDWLAYVPGDRHADMRAALQTMLATGLSQTYETMTKGADGAALWYTSNIGPLRRDGDIVGAVVVSQDITEKKRIQAELLVARRLAVLGTLAAGVAHELNTPIQFVGDSVRFLRDAGADLLQLITTSQGLRQSVLHGVAPEEAIAAAAKAEEETDLEYLRENMPAAFDRCIDGLNRVATIVRSLKEFAHPSGKEMAPVDLNQAIRSTLAIAAGEYRTVADLHTDLGELPPVVCHVGEINQVVLNIVVNAAHAIADVVKGSTHRGAITVRSRREGDDAVIAIRDTGGGIPEDLRGRIFDPFFTTKEVGRGTGQGLAISWTTVTEQHGGTLTYETTVGEGTTFFIRIPLAGVARAA